MFENLPSSAVFPLSLKFSYGIIYPALVKSNIRFPKMILLCILKSAVIKSMVRSLLTGASPETFLSTMVRPRLHWLGGRPGLATSVTCLARNPLNSVDCATALQCPECTPGTDEEVPSLALF